MLTQEQIRAVRLKDSEVVKLDRLGISVRVVMMGSSAALTIRDLQGSPGPTKDAQLFPLLLKGGLVQESGAPLTDADVEELVSVLSIDELMLLIEKVNSKVRPQKASPTSTSGDSTSSTTSASNSAGPTPIT